MKEVPFEVLKTKVIRPGIEKYLVPLCDFRGKTLGSCHRMWNYSLSMMAHEATLSDGTQRLGNNPQFSQLCMPERRPSALQLGVFAGALNARPKVAANEKGLLDYLMSVVRWPIDPNRTWHVQRDTWRAYSNSNPYPFLVHNHERPVDPLVALITKAVPAWLDREMKADLCQDLAVAVLCGDLKKEDIADGVKKFMPKLWKVNPSSKYGDMSLNARIPGRDDGLTWLDTLGSKVEKF